jgi:hypothetical protein
MKKILFSSLAIIALLGAGCTSQNLAPPPISGYWSFKIIEVSLTGSKCPAQGSAPYGTSGEAELSVNAPGEIVVINLDGQQIVFHRQPGNGSFYKTYTRLFPVGQSGAGSVYFDFTAQTSDTISGEIHWDNNKLCTGDYSFVMELLEADLSGEPETVVNTLSEGDWEVDVEDTQDNCVGAGIAGFTGVPAALELSYVVDLDTGAPSQDEFYVDPLGITIQQIPDTNVYTQTGAPFDVGTPVDGDGDILLDYEDETFEGTLEIQAGSDGTATGQLYVSGGSCGAMMTINLSSL